MQAQAGKVYLVGAGPGDPELLTVKAVRLLAEAGVVLHDDLVPDSILKLAAKDALVLSVGKRCGLKKITQAAIHDLMIVSARKGLTVVRLKSGDPMIFGRAAEEIDALRAAGVPFAVIPGVTAASSAAAFVEASLTDRRVSSKLIVLSGHHAAQVEEQGELWQGTFPEDATLAIYMPGRDFTQVAAALVRCGLSPSTPCVAVTGVAQPEAAYAASPLHSLERLPGSPSPTLLLVGKAFAATLAQNAMAEGLALETEAHTFYSPRLSVSGQTVHPDNE